LIDDSRLNFETMRNLEKLEWCSPTRWCGKVWRYLQSFRSIPALDRRMELVKKNIRNYSIFLSLVSMHSMGLRLLMWFTG